MWPFQDGVEKKWIAKLICNMLQISYFNFISVLAMDVFTMVLSDVDSSFFDLISEVSFFGFLLKTLSVCYSCCGDGPRCGPLYRSCRRISCYSSARSSRAMRFLILALLVASCASSSSQRDGVGPKGVTILEVTKRFSREILGSKIASTSRVAFVISVCKILDELTFWHGSQEGVPFDSWAEMVPNLASFRVEVSGSIVRLLNTLVVSLMAEAPARSLIKGLSIIWGFLVALQICEYEDGFCGT